MGETIGAALRTKSGTKPIFVSIGHKVDLESAVYWVLECCRGYRLPEPTRLAHLAAGGNLKQVKDTEVSTGIKQHSLVMELSVGKDARVRG